LIKVEDTRIIRAPIQKVFQLVSRLEAQPHVTGLWFSADLIDRRQNTATVLYKGYFGGIPLESVQRATLYPPQRVEFKQSRGGLKAFAGRYSLKPIDGETELSMQIEAEVGIALITEASARRVLYAYVERSLQKIKFLAERDLPRPVRRVVEDAAQAASATPTTAAGPSEPGPQGAVPPGVGLTGEGLPAPDPSATVPSGLPPSAPQATSPGPGSGRRRRRRRRRRRGGQSGTRDQGAKKPDSAPNSD
jgi:hypothetical protein